MGTKQHHIDHYRGRRDATGSPAARTAPRLLFACSTRGIMLFSGGIRSRGDCDQTAPGSHVSVLLACAKSAATAEDEALISQLLADEIDWTVFAPNRCLVCMPKWYKPG